VLVAHFAKNHQKQLLKEYMAQQGYKTYGEDIIDEWWTKENFIFIMDSSIGL
jgi:hypothetical protein